MRVNPILESVHTGGWHHIFGQAIQVIYNSVWEHVHVPWCSSRTSWVTWSCGLLSWTKMCSERDSPLKRLYRRTHAKLTHLAGSGQLVWAADCKLSLALVHARRPAWPGETSETIVQTCQLLRILRNHYAFRVSNTPLRKPVQNVGKLRILRNFGAIRPIPRNLQQLPCLAVSRKSPAGQKRDKDLFILRLPSHRRQISPSDQQRKLQSWSHTQWNVVLIVNRSNAGGSSPTWSPASPVYRSENTDEDC